MFERYRISSHLDKQPEEVQVNVLIYTLGNDAEDILNSFKLSDSEVTNYQIVLKKFTSPFVKKHNVIYERAKFNRLVQMEGETADSFITSLYTLVKTRSYGTLVDKLVRDRIAIGIRDKKLSESLQMDSELTVDKKQ